MYSLTTASISFNFRSNQKLSAMLKLRSHPPDVVVVVGSGDDAEEFECYQLILRMASEVFDAMLSGSMRESQTARIELPDKDPAEWKLFYEFIDPTACREAKITTANVMKLVPWFHQFQVERLSKECDQIMEAYLYSKQPKSWLKLTEAQFEKLIKWAGFSNLYGLPLTLEMSSHQVKDVLQGPYECVTFQSLKSLQPLISDNDRVWDSVKQYLPSEASDPSGPFADRNALAGNDLLPYILESGLQRKRETGDPRLISIETYVLDALQNKKADHRDAIASRCLKDVRLTMARYKNVER
jgi:hypothetical protein